MIVVGNVNSGFSICCFFFTKKREMRLGGGLLPRNWYMRLGAGFKSQGFWMLGSKLGGRFRIHWLTSIFSSSAQNLPNHRVVEHRYSKTPRKVQHIPRTYPGPCSPPVCEGNPFMPVLWGIWCMTVYDPGVCWNFARDIQKHMERNYFFQTTTVFGIYLKFPGRSIRYINIYSNM